MSQIKRILSMPTLSVLSAALVLGLSSCASTSGITSAVTDAATSVVGDDRSLTARVSDAIKGDPITRPFAIAVDSNEGVVELKGFVDTQEQVEKIGLLVENVDGVESVTNSLQVKPAS